MVYLILYFVLGGRLVMGSPRVSEARLRNVISRLLLDVDLPPIKKSSVHCALDWPMVLGVNRE
jgi:hypothetical protein